MNNRIEADRRRTQSFTVETVLIPHINKNLDRDLIFVCVQEMEDAMSNGPCSWAFKGNAQESLLAAELARLQGIVDKTETVIQGWIDRVERRNQQIDNDTTELARLKAILDKPESCLLRAWDFCVHTEKYVKSEWFAPQRQVVAAQQAAETANHNQERPGKK